MNSECIQQDKLYNKLSRTTFPRYALDLAAATFRPRDQAFSSLRGYNQVHVKPPFVSFYNLFKNNGGGWMMEFGAN